MKHESYLKNRDAIFERIKKKVTCECGSIINYGGLAEHKRSVKHMNFEKDKH